ncbi:MAG: acyl-CoA thioesterase [Fimbriimonas sp.]
MQGTVTEERIRVRYGETDQMGHAYYANYLYWFEQARGAWCRDRGFTYKQMEELGYFLPVVEAHVEYKGEVKYDDWITVRLWVEEMRRASMKFSYEILNESTGKITTLGHTWHVVMSAATRRAATVPPELRAWMDRDPAEHERLV